MYSNGIWHSGVYDGVLVSSRSHLRRNIHIVSHSNWHDLSKSPPLKETFATPTTSHSFMNVTYTCALRSNVRQRLHRVNPEWCDDIDCSLFESFDQGSDFITELCISIQPCDIVLYCPVIAAAMRVFTSASIDPCLSKATSSEMQQVPNKKPIPPSLTSTSFPLLHCDISELRVFLPVGKEEKCESFDVILMHLNLMQLHSQPDNPLQRLVIDNDIYQKAFYLGLTRQIGSALEDRQFQFDIVGCSLYSSKLF